tara:strand:+ start:2938 stop:3153 length:216 start_codon:yes stop_codon:yes gene_type:complete
MNSRTIERCNNKLRALYDEKTELETDIELSGGNWLATLEDQLHDLNNSIKELERQLREAEIEHLEQMQQVI